MLVCIIRQSQNITSRSAKQPHQRALPQTLTPPTYAVPTSPRPASQGLREGHSSRMWQEGRKTGADRETADRMALKSSQGKAVLPGLAA